jgi:hypothetical protein
MKVLASILSIIAFYLFYWIGKSIFYSFLTGSSTIGDIVRGEWIVAGVVGFVICALLTKLENVTPAYIIGAVTFGATYMPFSIGLVLIYNIIVIGSILYAIWGYDHIV